MAKIKLKTPQERLADLGRSVARKLKASGRAQIVAQNGLTLYFVQDFMSRTECEDLITLIDKGRQPSGLLSASADPEFRTSDSCNLSHLDPLVERIEGRICALMAKHCKGKSMKWGSSLRRTTTISCAGPCIGMR